MKKIVISGLFLCLLWCTGCKKSSEYDSEEIVRVTIASVKPVEKEENYDYNYEGCFLPIYIYKRGDEPEWRLWYSWGPIKGFDDVYEEGFEYVIDVYERYLTYSGVTGIPWRYQLKKIISWDKKDSEGIPERFISE